MINFLMEKTTTKILLCICNKNFVFISNECNCTVHDIIIWIKHEKKTKKNSSLFTLCISEFCVHTLFALENLNTERLQWIIGKRSLLNRQFKFVKLNRLRWQWNAFLMPLDNHLTMKIIMERFEFIT